MAKCCYFLAVVALQLLLPVDYSAAALPNDPPQLEAFANYEDMQNYFTNRKYRTLKSVENPTDDSYLDAYNRHNEQLDVEHKIVKRAAKNKQLPNEPTLIKFEATDAVEPSDELKQLIRQHRSREAKELKEQTGIAKAHRAKRATTLRQEPSNFKVHMIPFEVSDAREPDERTKMLIKRMRALDLKKMSLESNPRQVRTAKTPTRTATTKTKSAPTQATPAEKNRTRKAKTISPRGRQSRRSRRSAPQMFKFEIEDAKEPNESFRKQYTQQNFRESKDLKESSLSAIEANQTKAAEQNDMESSAGDESDNDDQNSHESKRMYVYKEAPMKTKKSLNSLPPEVQKVITHLIKEHKGVKAYVKYIPAQKKEREGLKSYQNAKLSLANYGLKLNPVSYVKYIEPAQKEQQLQVQVPVVEKVRYVYTPVAEVQQPQPAAYVPLKYVAPAPAPAQVAIAQPIVVPDQQPTAEQHFADYVQLYNRELQAAQAVKEIAAPQFRPSKPDPTYENNKLVDTHAGPTEPQYPRQLPVNHYQYEIFPEPADADISYGKAHLQQLHQQPEAEYIPPGPAPIIKIEYHAARDNLNENYKQMDEFKELSSLIGKSPEDQIHGLTYLLAKEMQNKLKQQRQQKQLEHEAQIKRPQDNTAPIQFHDHHIPLPRRAPVSEHSGLGVQPGRLIGMGKAKEYIPIVESQASADQKAVSAAASQSEFLQPAAPAKNVQGSVESKVHLPRSYFGLGLSNNYEGISGNTYVNEHKLINEQVAYQPLQRPKSTHNAAGLYSAAEPASEQKQGNNIQFGIQHSDRSKFQYASKYAFGYRIRDFHTGNDFGHKQNRDLNGVTRGQYHILLPDGRIQNVIYHADDTGFHADVSFESSH